MLWGTGMSPFLSQSTGPVYWPGKNLLTLKLPGPYVGMGGSLTVTVA